MIVSIASGKGGTGKTSLATNLALSLKNVQLLDCDVEEPNAHLFLHPKIDETKPVYISKPIIDERKCDHCGKCSIFCQYNALFVTPEEVMLFPQLCHGCEGCMIVCPKNAITKENVKIGVVKKGIVENMELVYGELDVGEPMPVPVIKAVKQQIKEDRTVIVDSPPGASCPAIESVYGSDYCILVSEPTPFGLHDLKIIVQVLEELNIPFGVVINRAGIGDRKIYDFCEENEVPILLEIPFQRKIAELYSRGIPFVVEMPQWKQRFQLLMDDIKRLVKT